MSRSGCHCFEDFNVFATLPVDVLETALALQGDRVSYDSAKVYKRGRKSILRRGDNSSHFIYLFTCLFLYIYVFILIYLLI